MSDHRTVSALDLPDLQNGARSPVWWAMILLVAIEATVFITLFSSYFYLRFRNPEWPPAGIPEPDLMLPIVNTGVLFASSIAVLWASGGAKKGDLKRLKIGFGIGIVLEVVFFGIKIMLETGGGHGWADHAYSSIYWTISRLHTAHVFAAILMASVAEILVFRGYFTGERRLGIQVVNIYWQFVAIIWVPLFVVIYLVPLL